MVAFSNSEEGRILIGISDDGKMIGILSSEIGRISQLNSNAASQHMRCYPKTLDRVEVVTIKRDVLNQ